MRKTEMKTKTKITLSGIEGFLKRKVTLFGNGAKVNCPKEYLGKKVYLIILKN